MADKSLIGRPLGMTTVEVEKGRLRMFAHAIGETDPVYVDEGAAHDAGHPSLPVPPTFLLCLENEGRNMQDMLDLLQFDQGRMLHAEQEFTYHRMCHAGDTLTFDARIADIYDKKAGALQFAVTETRVTNQHGEHVADLRCALVQR